MLSGLIGGGETSETYRDAESDKKLRMGESFCFLQRTGKPNDQTAVRKLS
jgi:hypothetical protein